MPIRMTTHDEIVFECDEARAEEAKAILRREMLTVPDWAVRAYRCSPRRASVSTTPRRRRDCDERPLYRRALSTRTRSAPRRGSTSTTARFLIAPLGAGKGGAALTAFAELLRDRLRRHALVIAPKLVASTVWPAEVADLAAPPASTDRRP